MKNLTLQSELIGCLILIVSAAAFGADVSASDVGASKAKPCLSCHNAANFAGKDAQELVASMQSIKAGELAHLPLPASLTDEDLAAIAAYLAAVANPDAEG